MIGFAWTHGYGLLLTIAGTIVTIGGAIAVASGGARWLLQQVRPSEPLVSFGHPAEDPTPWAMVVTSDPAQVRRAKAQIELARLPKLHVSYLIENKDTVPLRNLSTGIRTRADDEHTFDKHYVQILGAGEPTQVAHAEVPEALHAGMTEEDRGLNFLYWARFERVGTRWEASYDPKTRALSYKRLRRKVRQPSALTRKAGSLR